MTLAPQLFRTNMTNVVTEAATREIQLREAKATLSSVVDDAKRGEPSIITRHGKPEAVVIGFDERQKLTRPSFAEFLLSSPLEPGDIPERERSPWRTIDFGS